ncbi:MAG: 50S ribosomal protein L29 [Alphaproteobacteria bacterium]|nr:50S ribosomal protein L29 [Alphaproteobacteria bacterium]
MTFNHLTDLADVNAELRNKRRDHMRARFRKAAGQLDNPMELRKLRKDIARLATRATTLRNQQEVSPNA